MQTKKIMKENILIVYDILILLLLNNVYDIFVFIFIRILWYSDHEYREKHLNEEEKDNYEAVDNYTNHDMVRYGIIRDYLTLFCMI